MDKIKFLKAYPQAYYLDGEDIDPLRDYLQKQQWLTATEKIDHIAKAGEGNMNYTLRITTDKQSFIIKQSRPWVEKYAHIPAPADRVLMEGQFYRLVATDKDVAAQMPHLIGLDKQSLILAMQDLGEAKDFTSLYVGEILGQEHLNELALYLGRLHHRFTTNRIKEPLSNRDMRKLNYEHIFHLPLQPENGLDLDAITLGLQKAAVELQENREYTTNVQKLGELYLQDGPTLLHGDYYPGSWLKTSQGVRIIDPEFCFFGFAEFDIGVALAHLWLAQQPAPMIDRFCELYGSENKYDHNLALQFAGVEIMRRLIGVAQLPLNSTLQQKEKLLGFSAQLVVHSR